MKFQILLFFLALTAVQENSVFGFGYKKIEFGTDILLNDLQAISQYYDKFKERPTAYVRLPNDVTFKVQWDQDDYLKVDGSFKVVNVGEPKKTPCIYHNGLYYKNGNYFIKELVTRSKKQISGNAWVRYKQPSLEIGQKDGGEYLVITYSSLEEVKPHAVFFYISNKKYFTKPPVLCQPSTMLSPSVFLTNIDGNFLEYTLLVTDATSTVPMADGGLRVLIGTTKDNNKLKLISNTKALRLVFNPYTQKLTIPEDGRVNSQPLVNVFGIRMAKTGFLSKKAIDGSLKVLGSRELSLEDPPPTHFFRTFNDLLKKVTTVEPRLPCFSPELDGSATLSIARFQFGGQTLVKSVQLRDGRVNEDCPILVKFELEKFWINGGWEEKFCTDESKLWLQTKEGPLFIETEKLVKVESGRFPL